MICIENYIPVGHKNAVTREYLRTVTGLSDRKLRELIKKSNTLILNLQDGKGYFIASKDEDHLVRLFIRQERARGRNVMEIVRKSEEYLKAKKQLEDDIKTGQMNLSSFLEY